jgi:glyoxylase-like metal-dependent hydrolase (beta-lactamase superfamily II)
MHELRPGLYQLSRGANVFILETAPDELTIVDTGIPGTTGKILDAVREMGKTPQHIKHILITHADFDHAGSLQGLVEKTGATVYAGSQTAAHLANVTSPDHLPTVFRWISTPFQKLFQNPVTVDEEVKNGQQLPIGGGIQVLSIPGHTPDNMGFYWEKFDVLFAADLLNTQGGTLGLTPPPITWDMNEARKSARKALDTRPAIICVGHGDAVHLSKKPSAADALRQQIQPQASPAGAS